MLDLVSGDAGVGEKRVGEREGDKERWERLARARTRRGPHTLSLKRMAI